MDREELEKEVLKRLHITKQSDIPILKDAIVMKDTADLEDILARMKAEGR